MIGQGAEIAGQLRVIRQLSGYTDQHRRESIQPRGLRLTLEQHARVVGRRRTVHRLQLPGQTHGGDTTLGCHQPGEVVRGDADGAVDAGLQQVRHSLLPGNQVLVAERLPDGLHQPAGDVRDHSGRKGHEGPPRPVVLHPDHRGGQRRLPDGAICDQQGLLRLDGPVTGARRDADGAAHAVARVRTVDQRRDDTQAGQRKGQQDEQVRTHQPRPLPMRTARHETLPADGPVLSGAVTRQLSAESALLVERGLGDVVHDAVGHEVPDRLARRTRARQSVELIASAGTSSRLTAAVREAVVDQLVPRPGHPDEVREREQLRRAVPAEDRLERVSAGDEEQLGAGAVRSPQVAAACRSCTSARAGRCRPG